VHTKDHRLTTKRDFIHCIIALEKKSTLQSPMSLPVQIYVVYSSGEITESLNSYTFNIQLILWQLCVHHSAKQQSNQHKGAHAINFCM